MNTDLETDIIARNLGQVAGMKEDELHPETFEFGRHALTVQVRRSTERTSNFKLTVQVSRKELFNSLQDFGGAPWSSSSDEEGVDLGAGCLGAAGPSDLDALGLDIWPAAVTLCRYITDNPDVVTGKQVIELGAGVGLPGLFAAKVGAMRSIISDYDASVVAHANGQAVACGLSDVARACIVDWKEPVVDVFREAFDVVMAADVLYMSFLVPDLLRTCYACLKPDGRVLLTHQCRQSLVDEGGEMVVVDRDVSFETFKDEVARHRKLCLRVISETPSEGFPGPMMIIELTLNAAT